MEIHSLIGLTGRISWCLLLVISSACFLYCKYSIEDVKFQEGRIDFLIRGDNIRKGEESP